MAPGEGRLEVGGGLAEVRPVGGVEADHLRGPQRGRGGDGIRRGQCERGVEPRHPGGAREQDGDIHRGEAVGDLAHERYRGVVAADVDGRFARRLEHETGHGPDELLRAGRAVQRGHRGDGDAPDLVGLPVVQADDAAAEQIARRFEGGEGRNAGRDQLEALPVEVVFVTVVRQQDEVDLAEFVPAERRPGGLHEGGLARVLVGLRDVERGVGDDPQARVFEEGGGSADPGDGCRRHTASLR